MEQCFRCLRDEEEVKLLDAIYENEVVKICEECATVENIPIIRKPNIFQLRETRKPYTVKQRLSRMAGLPVEEQEGKVSQEKRSLSGKEKKDLKDITLDDLWERKKRKEAEKKFEEKMMSIKEINKPLDLIDNFHWYIQMARRKKKLSPEQLANAIGVPEQVIKMVEEGKLPDDGHVLIGRLEQFFEIKLKKSERLQEMERIEEVRKDQSQPARIISFKPEAVRNLTIADLQEMKDEKQKEEKEGLIGDDIELEEEEE